MDEEQPRSQLNRRDRSFHELIVAASGNSLLAEMHQRTQFHYWNLRLPVIFGREQTQRSNDQHKQILAALEAGDPDAAEAAARTHIQATFAIVREALEDV
jgi:DNA-binding GntR family transcriptional regulator